MNSTTDSARNGKIAHLPRSVQDRINQRLYEGQTAVSLMHELNAIPEVQAMLAKFFYGHPINEVNMHEWRSGGYQDWLRKKAAHDRDREFVADTLEHAAVTEGQLAEANFNLASLRIAKTLESWDGQVT